jgi:DNA-binding NtrC family response regulator
MPKTCILVVDRDPLLRETICQMIQVTNYICFSKSSFSSLTGTLQDIAFSAALVRLGSGEPEENTFMAEAKLLQPWIKIIVISGTRTSMQPLANYDAILTLPFSVDLLQDTLHEVLQIPAGNPNPHHSV